MKKIFWLVALLYSSSSGVLAYSTSAKASVTLQFYSAPLTVLYNTDMFSARCSKVEEKSLVDYYQQLEKTDYKTLLDCLQQQQVQLHLNDWLFFQLLRTSINEIFQQKSELERELIGWFLLSKAGFDTRLTYLGKNVFLYVQATDELFEVPIIEENGKNYANLTSIYTVSKPETLYLLDFAPRPKGKPFSFALKHLPNLPASPRTRLLTFQCRDSVYTVSAEYDQTLVNLMRKYPLIAEKEYLEFPMSTPLINSLVPQLQTLLRNKSPRQSLELLLAFTRSCFEYREDREFFGKSKPMIADEVFYYQYSDCEDRSALFYQLVKTLLEHSMIILAYPNHITVGVELAETVRGISVENQGKRYYICDPTGPVNSAAIGVFPEDYAKIPFEIITRYK